MRRISILVVLVWSAMLEMVSGQGLSNKGKEFWVGYGHNWYMEPAQGNAQEMVLYLSAEQPATVTVSVNGTTWTRTYTIPANTVVATDYLPKSGASDSRLWSPPVTFGGNNGEGVFTRGIHVVSDTPIVAYAHIFSGRSSGATMLMPVETWGYSYVSVNATQSTTPNCFSWVNVIASHDNTRIQVTPSVATRNGTQPGTTLTINLNKGEVYQMLSSPTGNPNTGYDLTGTTVKSVANNSGVCYPVAVLSGSSLTYMQFGCGGASGDSYIQQVFPAQAWGKRYLTAPTSASTNANVLATNGYRVVVKDPTTVVRRNGVVLTGLTGNSYYQFSSSTADYITADKPVLVAQYMSSQGDVGYPGCYPGVGDPEIFYLSSIEQSIQRTGFYRNNRYMVDVNYLTLVIPAAGISSLLIDGANTYDYSYPHPNLPGYSVVVKRWTAAQAQCRVSSDSGFTAITYGLGNFESYGYNAGTLINNLSAIGEIKNVYDSSTAPNAFTCKNTPFLPSVLIAYPPTQLIWQLSSVPGITPGINITDLAPTPISTEVINGNTYYRYRLNQPYRFSDTGTFYIPVLATHPSVDHCNNTEELRIPVVVKPSPVANFSFSNSLNSSFFSACTLDTVYFNGTAVAPAGVSAVNRYKWNFTTAAGDTAVVQNPKWLFAPGTYNVALTATTPEGCLGDTTKTITIYPKPTAAFTTNPVAACAPATITATSSAAYSGNAPITSWYWDGGSSQTITNNTGAPVSLSYPNYGAYPIKHVVKVSNLCVSDTAIQTVQVNAKPVASFTYPQGCLPAGGLAQFSSTSTVADGQSLSYTWDFGDPASGANNTATVANPSHQYNTFGSYVVKLTVRSGTCTKDTSVTIAFSLRPVLAYPSLQGRCINGTSVSVANATVVNGVPGTGSYRGPGTNAAGIFSPALAGVGNHTIWYIFQPSSGLCADSISQTITVFPKPSAAFVTSSASICADTAITVTAQSSVPTGVIQDWYWNFGDNTTAVYTHPNPFTKSYPAGTYAIRHYVVSDSSCVSDTVTQTVTVWPLPLADFTLPASVCMPAGRAQFTNASSVTGGGTLLYNWDFGDQTPVSTTANPVHLYTGNGPFNVKLTVMTTAGCKDDSTQVLSAFYQQPVARFLVNPTILCQGASNTFIDGSTAAASTITRWSWSFGDGSISANRNPVKRYSQPNTYQVALVVANAQGCLSDTARQTVSVLLQPRIDAGPSFTVVEGTTVQFAASRNDTTVRLQWVPATGLSNDTILTPSLIVRSNQVYYLTGTGNGNCTATDSLTVTVLRPLQIPNVFSPNGDGINDTWVIPHLSDYSNATIELFDRYGKSIARYTSYARPWDGTVNGKPVPVGTYYYVIDLKNNIRPISGPVTVVR